MRRILCSAGLATCVATMTVAAPAQGRESLDPSFGEGGISFPGVGTVSINALAQGSDERFVGTGGDPVNSW